MANYSSADVLRIDYDCDGTSHHEDDDDDDDGSWIEISSSSSSSSEDEDDEDDDLSYDVSIHDELLISPETTEYVSTVRASRYGGKQIYSEYSSSATTSSRTSWQTMRRHLWLATKLCFILCLVVLTKLALLSSSLDLDFDLRDNEESIYVPGVGFSGFWFSLGRMKSIPDPASKHYVCFSAGCLGSVAILNGFSVDEMACMAQSAQLAWKDGHINRYEVVSNFVDGLVYRDFPAGPGEDVLGCLERLGLIHNDNYDDDGNVSNVTKMVTNLGNNAELLSRLHILTTTRSMKASMRSPTNLLELREMLIQTTWM